MQYEKICFSAMEVVKTAAVYVRDRHENRKDLAIQEKGRQDFVTEVDKKAEEILVSGLSELLPEAGFIAEGFGGELVEGIDLDLDQQTGMGSPSPGHEIRQGGLP